MLRLLRETNEMLGGETKICGGGGLTAVAAVWSLSSCLMSLIASSDASVKLPWQKIQIAHAFTEAGGGALQTAERRTL